MIFRLKMKTQKEMSVNHSGKTMSRIIYYYVSVEYMQYS